MKLKLLRVALIEHAPVFLVPRPGWRTSAMAAPSQRSTSRSTRSAWTAATTIAGHAITPLGLVVSYHLI